MIGLTPAELSTAVGIGKSTCYALLSKMDIQQPNSKKHVPSTIVRDLLLEKGFVIPNKNISFQVVKGGAGKTTLATNFSYRCSQYGIKVLLIDFDQQGNATRYFNVDARDKPVFLNLFRGEEKVENSIVQINDFLHMIPSNLNNSRLDFEMSQKISFNVRDIIKNVISPIRKNYDLIVMDCPPAINRINASVTCASDLVIIPINPDQYALDGMQFSISEIENIKKDFNMESLDYRLIWNKYDAREKLGSLYMHTLVRDETRIDKILPVVIRVDSDFKNSIHENRTVFEVSKKSSAKEDIDGFVREVTGLKDWTEQNMKASDNGFK